MYTFHFISGLPRSGTTLLAAILQQNPAFHASVESPTGRLFTDAIATMGGETSVFVSDEQRRSILKGMFYGYYSSRGREGGATIFDNNRKWCANASAVAQVFPDSRIITCVRPLAEIVDSLERHLHDNPLWASVILHGRSNTTLYDRMGIYLDRQKGLVGWAWEAVRSAYYGHAMERLYIIEYENLARYPQEVLSRLHQTLDLPPFSYQFDAIRQIPLAAEFDQMLRAPGLHTVGPVVKYIPQSPALPPDVLQALQTNKPFWRADAPA